jgi:hypothetical protein
MLVLALSAITPAAETPSRALPPLVLLAIALIAAIYLALSRSSPAPTTLPTTVTQVPAPSAKDAPLDIDVELDPESFYPRLRIKKLALLGVLLALEAESLFKICWDGARGAQWGMRIEDGLMAVFWVSREVEERVLFDGACSRTPQSRGTRWPMEGAYGSVRLLSAPRAGRIGRKPCQFGDDVHTFTRSFVR